MDARKTNSKMERTVLAERYKTKLCGNYLTEGECPYTERCMFAHGESELRTREMNLRDGLVTEAKIRSFHRAKAFRERKAAAAAAMLAASTHSGDCSTPRSELSDSLESAASTFDVVRSWRHNPYSWSGVDELDH